MRIKTFFAAIALMCMLKANAQEKWSLLKCVQYAMENNISIKQIDLQTKLAELQYKQSRLDQYPSVNFSANPGYNSGRNQDPTSFSLITQSYFSANLQLQTSADIFNWFSKKNTIAANQWEVEAAKASTDKLKNDIALAVANAYLQVLLSREQEKITLVQVQQSLAQLSNTRKLVDAGSLPELNATTLESGVATDSAAYLTAKGNVTQSLLNLKAYMGIEADSPFDIDAPTAEMIPVLPMAELQPDIVYTSAIANQPLQKQNNFKLQAAEKTVAAMKGRMYPTIGVYGNFRSGFNSRGTEIVGLRGISPVGTTVINGVNYDVFPLQPSFNYGKSAFFTQIDQNFGRSFGLSVNVPIFNGGLLRTNWQKSKINVRNLELQRDLDNQTLKQNIYQAYNSANVAMLKFNASSKAVSAADQSYFFAQKRYEVGMLSTFDLITTQNNLFRAKLEYTLNQFDYVFKMKVLEFYKGQGLKF